ncbi:Notchless protein [Ceratobasidium sp. AG-Ba]|nr:Notchless protein [Ceratobasidium sp. AG-Ba]
MDERPKRTLKRAKRFFHNLFDDPITSPRRITASRSMSTLSKLYHRGSGGWTGLKGFATALNKSVNVFGPLKEAMDMLVSLIGTFEAAAGNREDYRELKTELDGLFSEIEVYMGGPAQATITSSIRNLARGIKRETDIVEQLRQRSMMSRYVDGEQDADEILACYRRIGGLLQRLMLNTTLDMRREVSEIAMENYLQRLPNSPAAYYCSAGSTSLRRGGCTPNTRVDVLKELHKWARSPTSKKIYWINGMAGTGKTTIAYSLCEELERSDSLAASFFCSRQFAECRDVNRIVPTIAYQLSRFSSPFRQLACEVLKQNPDVYNKPVLEQFKSLIAQPLNRVKDALPTGLVIVIDALDDAIPKQARPDPSILAHIRHKQGERVSTEMQLHELSQTDVQGDIRTYLTAELASSVSLADGEIELLAAQSGVLFIYAATVARYIKGQNLARGRQRLTQRPV